MRSFDDDVAPDESVSFTVRLETAAGAIAFVRDEALRAARESQEQLREMVEREQREAQEFFPRTVEREQREAQEQLRLMMERQRQMLRDVEAEYRRRFGRAVDDRCRWSRTRSTISARTPRRRVARRITPSRDGPHRRSSDDDPHDVVLVGALG